MVARGAMTRHWGKWALGVIAIVVVIAALAIALRSPGSRSSEPRRGVAGTNSGATPAAAAVNPVNATTISVAGADAVSVGTRMVHDDAVADDVLFLIMAAQRGRCAPVQAHDLPRMAVIARLPTLSAAAGSSAEAAALRQGVRSVVRAIVHDAPCTGALDLRIGPYTRVIDPKAYASAFPDSYFDPSLISASTEFHGAGLHDRVEDTCTPVAYAVLPLDETRPWQCAGMRATARSRILALCRAEGASPDSAAADIKNLVGGLPANCQ
ncbi:hypothetical protein [Luteibacter yeojuensis]|uniref:hypothetical protein n=1 Tax=Luteibacter yeojuensis TaxID=345309 RepID=UPI0018DD55F7|nr:hypothetical protein [Luteibacter yeojuensis]